jgi:signal transduction histidine kinase
VLVQRPTPEDYQPALTPWRQAWRILGMLVVVAIAWGPLARNQVRDHPGLLALDLVLGAAAFVAVFHRRRWPLAVALLTAGLSAFSGIAAGPAVLASVSLATRRRIWQVALVGAVNIVAGQTVVVVQPGNSADPAWLTVTVTTVFTAAVLGWGMYIGSRRELIWTLKNRAERAESEQELRVGQARSTERARIAREMHDVLAHRISQISMHAGALSFRDDLSAEQMRSSAQVIQEKAHEALTDLRGVLGVLRDTETGALLDAPQPTYDDLPCLVEEARRSGLHVQYDDRVDHGGTPVPHVVGRTVYRIVQEGMTNVRKHAPGALLSIHVSGSPDEGIDVLLRNPLGFRPSRTPGAGLGLIGLAERAQLRGGRLEHHRDGSTFVLHAWIPWAA